MIINVSHAGRVKVKLKVPVLLPKRNLRESTGTNKSSFKDFVIVPPKDAILHKKKTLRRGKKK